MQAVSNASAPQNLKSSGQDATMTESEQDGPIKLVIPPLKPVPLLQKQPTNETGN